MDCYKIRHGMRAIVSDAFNRANGYLGNSETGQAWLTSGSPTTAWNVSSNSAKRSSATSSGTDVAHIDAGKSNVIVSAGIRPGGFANQYIVARMSGASVNNCIMFAFNVNDGVTAIIQITKTISGASTTLASVNFPYTMGNTYLCSLSCIGNDFTASIDGVPILSATDDNALKTNTMVGMFIPFASGVTYTEDYMDNFTARG